MKMRVLGLMLTLVLGTALVLAACGEDETTPQAVPERPVVRLEVGDQAFDESVYSYCWPESADNLECDVDAVALVQPVENVPVAPGSEVKIVVEPGEGEPTPTSLKATLLGFEQTQDYGAAAEGVFPVPAQDDLYRVRVDVQYGDVEGYEAYVSYVFGLDVSAEVAAVPTTTAEIGTGAETPAASETTAAVEPTIAAPEAGAQTPGAAEPTTAGTETPFMTATFVPTSTLLPADTVETTEAATEEGARPEEITPPVQSSGGMTIEGVTSTPGTAAAESPEATEAMGVAGATLAPETPAFEAPQTEVSETAGVTEATLEPETPAPAATETPIPTVAPTETPAPSATPQPTATLMPTEPPTSTPVPLPTEPPAASATPAPTEAPSTEQAPGEAPAAGLTPAPTEPPSTEQVPAETPGATPAPAELGTIALNGVVRLHSAGITVPVVGAEVSYKQISAVNEYRNSQGELYTDKGGRFTFPLIALNAADTIEITATAPGFQAQTITRRGADVWQSDGTFQLVLEPVKAEPQITPRISAAEAPSAGETPAQPEAPAAETSQAAAPLTMPEVPENVPPLALVVDGQAYAPAGYQHCRSSESGEQVCSELPAPSAPTQRVPLQRGAMAQILIEGEPPDTLTVEYLSDSGTPVTEPESVAGDNIVLLIVAPAPGSYILVLHLSWVDSEASYYYRVLVEV